MPRFSCSDPAPTSPFAGLVPEPLLPSTEICEGTATRNYPNPELPQKQFWQCPVSLVYNLIDSPNSQSLVGNMGGAV